jgi:hypothetical protein
VRRSRFAFNPRPIFEPAGLPEISFDKSKAPLSSTHIPSPQGLQAPDLYSLAITLLRLFISPDETLPSLRNGSAQ